jgi:hypothetical protein
MKARESGMPDEAVWEAFFDADCMIEQLRCAERGDENVVEFGSGYGTFTLPLARRTSGIVHALDIETNLTATIRDTAGAAGLTISTPNRGTSLPTAAACTPRASITR